MISFCRLAVRQLLVVIPAGSLVLAAACASRDQSAPATECYRFDRPYFSWIWKPGRDLLIDSSALIELQPTPMHPTWTLAAGEVAPLQLRIPRMAGDSLIEATHSGSSYWRPLTADSIELWWSDGSSGPTFRLARRHDSLVGTMDFKTDFAGSEPPRRRATAVRVRC